jgi:serine/threonine protein kinase
LKRSRRAASSATIEETAVLRDDDDVLFFRSKTSEHDLAVKCWNGVEPDPLRQDYSMRLLAFFERARTLRGCTIRGLPRIVDFGLSRKNLLLVRDWVEGPTLQEWLATDPDLEARLRLGQGLADVIARLHALELPHGDVHPGNVIVASGNQSVLIDALDFDHAPGDAYTTAYLPAEYKTMSPVQRDRYGPCGCHRRGVGRLADAASRALPNPEGLRPGFTAAVGT